MSGAQGGRRHRPTGVGRATAAVGLVASVVCLTVGVMTTPAMAAGESVSVSPNTGLTDGQNASVTFTTTGTTEATVFLGITQCGNATSSGTPLTVAAANDCMGAAGLGTTLLTFGASGVGGLAGPVAAGTHTVTLKMKKTGLGTNGAQCIPVAQATIPCRVSISTATFAGAYAGPGYNFVATAAISYDAPATTTTSTTSSSTTSSSTTTTSTPGSTTTSTPGSTTTSTPGSTTTSTPGSTTTSSSTSTSSTSSTAPTTTAPTTTTTAPTLKTFDCTDIPLPASSLVLSTNRCLAAGESVTVSAPAGTFAGSSAGASVPASTAFVLQCNPDPSIPTSSGAGCNVGGLKTPTIGADGSLPSTPVVIVTGAIGADPKAVCPPTQAQADAGVVNCVIAASPGVDPAAAASAQFTVQGQTVQLPVDASGNPVTTTTQPAGGGGDPEVLGATTIAPATVTPVSGTLPYTGLGGNTWFIVGMAILLVDFGAVASSYAKRRMVG
jgi:hypothetical protein